MVSFGTRGSNLAPQMKIDGFLLVAFFFEKKGYFTEKTIQ